MRYFWLFASAAWALLTFQLTTTPQVVVTEDTFWQMAIMMAAHFIFFGIQAGLLYLALPSRILAIFSASLYGLIIELIQRGVPGRTADPLDWLLDTLGAFVFLFLVRKYRKV